jgi:hypothetical protein
LPVPPERMAVSLDFAAAVLLGMLVAIAELVSRYRDAPREALYTRPALLYLAINGAASALALALSRGFGWTFGAAAGVAHWTQVLVAGLGAMALFRTSLFTVRAGDKDVGVGPATFLQIFRDSADRAVDRLRAQARCRLVGKLMEGIDYGKASAGLTPYCVALMQNAPADELQKTLNAVDLLNGAPIDNAIKARILGLHLMNLVGPDVLTAAVEALRKDLKQQGDNSDISQTD